MMVMMIVSMRMSSSLPEVKKRIIEKEKFSEERSLDYLNNLIKSGSRVSLSEENLHAKSFLLQQIDQIFQTNRSDIHYQIDLQNSSFNQLENILIRLSNSPPKNSSKESILLTAHYDTGGTKDLFFGKINERNVVEFSCGSSDDGCGIVILLEILSNLVNDLRVKYLKNDLIILFTNGEEIGAEGAQAFIQHQWFTNIIYFLSIDASICHQKAQLVRMKPSKVCFFFCLFKDKCNYFS